MTKKVLIFGLNYEPEMVGCARFTTPLVEFIASDLEIDCLVFSAKPYYPEWKTYEAYRGLGFNKSVVKKTHIIRAPIYVPNKPTAIRRIMHLLSYFFLALIFLPKFILYQPSHIIVILPTIVITPVAFIVKIITRAKMHLHVQDLEIDTFKQVLFNDKNKLFKILFYFLKFFELILMKFADSISTISIGMKREIISITSSRQVGVFRNWYDIGFSERNNVVKSGTKTILYAGSMGDKQGLEIIFKIAEKLTRLGIKDFEFVLAGSGSAKDRLVKLAEGNKWVTVRDQYPEEEFHLALSNAFCHILPQRCDISDLVLPSKLSNIWALGGNAIVAADQQSEIRSINGKYPGICELVEPENVDMFVTVIEKVLLEGQSFNQVAFDFAKDNLSKEKILPEMCEYILN